MFYFVFSFFRFLCLTLDVILITSISFLLSLLPLWFTKLFMHHLFRRVCWSFIHLLEVQYHIHHMFSPPLPKRYILISNHPSGFEILLLNAYFSVYPLAKSGVQNWWFLGRIAKAAGVVFVEREAKQSRNQAKESMVSGEKQGKNLLIYPEGGCFGKHLRPFKYGAFDIAIRSGVPILPIYMQYEAENSFEWGDHGLLRMLYNIWTAPNKHAHCYIFDPIVPDAFDDPRDFTDYVHKFYEKWEDKYRLG